MGNAKSGSSYEKKADIKARMDALAAELRANGLDAKVHVTHGTTDITATLPQSGRKDSHVVIDEDGYTELRYWADPAADPGQAVAAVLRALAVIAEAFQPGQPPPT
jgi:hypothetical protein